jgi:hypothetical protein
MKHKSWAGNLINKHRGEVNKVSPEMAKNDSVILWRMAQELAKANRRIKKLERVAAYHAEVCKNGVK